MNGVEISKQIGLHPRTVQKLIKKWDEGGRRSLPTHSHGGGIASIYTPRTLCNIKRQLDCNPTITARQLKEQNPNILGNVGVRSIQRAVREKLHYKKVKARSKPLLTDRQRKRCILFAKKYSAWSDEDWSGVLWSDEATFFTSDTKGKKVWRGPGSDPCNPKFTAKTVKHPPSLMVWGCFGYGGTGSLVVLPKGISVNADRYLTILKNHLAVSFAKTGTWIYQQDGAPCHTAKKVKKWLSNQEISYIEDWPGQSPDISPIENLWAILKARIREKDTSTIDKLEKELRMGWEELPPSLLQNLALSVPRRLQEVKERKGFPTRR